MEATLIIPITTIINLMWEKKAPGPNPKNELVDTKCSEKRGLKDGLARTGVWWIGIPGAATASTCIPWHADLSQFLSGWVLCGYSLPRRCLRLIRYSFFSLSILSPHFSRRFSSSVPKHPVSLGSLWCKLLGKTSLPVIFQDKSG